MSKIVSLDISSTNIGFSVLNSKNIVESYGVVSSKKKISKERIYHLAKNLVQLINFNEVSTLILEAYYGHGTKGACGVPEAKGAVLQEILNVTKNESILFTEITHSSAKKGIIGAGNADKQEVLAFIKKLGYNTDSFDCADSLINLMFYIENNKRIELQKIVKDNSDEESKACKSKLQKSRKHSKHRDKDKKRVSKKRK